MPTSRFETLAEGLATRDRDLAGRLPEIGASMDALRARAERALAAFREVAVKRGAPHLTHVAVGPLEPDEKHVDCLQFRVQRGRWEVVCVGKPRGAVVLVGPYRAGKPERPCAEHALPSAEADAALDDTLLALLCEASRR